MSDLERDILHEYARQEESRISRLGLGTHQQCCRTCRWWHEKHADLGDCMLTEMNRGDREHPESRAWAADDDGFFAILETRADFACNQWQEREP